MAKKQVSEGQKYSSFGTIKFEVLISHPCLDVKEETGPRRLEPRRVVWAGYLSQGEVMNT